MARRRWFRAMSGLAAVATRLCRCRQVFTPRYEFGGRFAQTSVRLDIASLEALCARWLSFPLEQPLRFELRPLSPDLESAWTQAVALLISYERMDIVLPPAASLAFDEFMLSLVLAKHQHNYSDDLHRASGAAAPRIVRE